jgi:hypothetical protein
MKKIAAIFAALLVTAGALRAEDEIVANVAFKVTDGFIDIQRAFNDRFDVTNAAPNLAGGTVSVGTNTHQLLDFGNVSVIGWTFVRSLDATGVCNRVQIGVQGASTNFLPLIELKAGEYGLFRLARGVSVYAQSVYTAGEGSATNSASRLERLAVDD